MGPSRLETFDPKPDAPQEVRGPLSTIATNLTGVRKLHTGDGRPVRVAPDGARVVSELMA